MPAGALPHHLGPHRQYPVVRVPSSVYASSDSTLADSLPPSPRTQSPCDEEHGKVGQHDDGESIKKEKPAEKEPLFKKGSLVKLLASLSVGIIVCLIIAAVMGKIRTTNSHAQQSLQNAQNATNTVISEDKVASTTTPIATSMSMTTSTTSSATPTTTAKPTSRISLPSGRSMANFDCPYLKEPRNRSPDTQLNIPERLCKLVPEKDPSLQDRTNFATMDMYTIDGCMLARGSYKGTDGQIAYRCTVNCMDTGQGEKSTDGVFGCN